MPGQTPVARETLAGDDDRVPIPDDGQEHACVCGSTGYSAWDGDGWLGSGRVVTNDEGECTSWCRSCDRELVVVTAAPG